MNNIVSSEGAAKTTMCALLLGAVLNIGLDPLFIYILDMGVEGAAIATAISQMVSTLVYLTYVLRKKSAFSFSVKVFSPTGQMMAEILKIGVPTLVFQLLTSLSIALINRASSNYSDSVIAGMGAVTRITSMGTLVVFGFLKGFQPIAGFSYGAKKFDRLREAIKTSIIWSTSFCLVVGLVMAVFSTQIISQFTKGDTQMILVGQKSLFANGITFILFGFYTVYSSLFLALGKGAAGFFLGACRQGVCFVPVILLLPMVWGMNGILYAQPIADVISVVITVFMALHLHRELSMAEKTGYVQFGNVKRRRKNVSLPYGRKRRKPSTEEDKMKIEWILCPFCGSKTRLKIRDDTVLENFPLYCPKCKHETLIAVRKLNLSIIQEPDAQTQSR